MSLATGANIRLQGVNDDDKAVQITEGLGAGAPDEGPEADENGDIPTSCRRRSGCRRGTPP